MNNYNGYTREYCEGNLPANMIESHKALYMKNVDRVIECQTTKMNVHEIESLKNSNHLLVTLYLFS